MARRVARLVLVMAITTAMLAIPVATAGAATSSTYRDEFASGFTGSDGSLAWTTDWLETAESDGPGAGSIEVLAEPHCLSGPCFVLGRFGPAEVSVEREADLSGMGSATLRFDYKRHMHIGGAGQVILEISRDGGGDWAQLDIWNLGVTDPTNQTTAYNITPYLSSDTRVRFRLTNSSDQSHFNVDNVEIAEGTWATVESGSITHLDGLYTADSSRAYAVGNGGTILATDDGGATWESRPSGVADDLNAVFFANGTDGFVSGDAGTLLRTTNGGNTWTPKGPGSTERLNDLYFIDAWVGYVVGDNGTIFRTDNSANSWTPQTSGTGSHLTALDFINASTGYAVGQDGVILKTTNGGATWNSQISGTGNHLESVFFLDANKGFAVGDFGTLLETNNGGATWVESNLGVALNAVFFTDANKGYIVGSAGALFSTNNGGAGWTTEPVPTIVNLNDVHFSPAGNGFIVGNNGTILTWLNTPPTVDEPDDLVIAADSPFSLTVTATDADFDPLTLSAAGLPAWASFTDNGDNTATISGTPLPSDAGPSSITVTADDGFGNSDSDEFEVLVVERGTVYLVGSDGEDLLTNVDATDIDPTTNEGDIGPTGTANLGSLSFQPVTGTLFAVDGGQLGTIDLTTGAFTALPSLIGTASGAKGLVAITDVTGIAFEQSTGWLYGTTDRGTGQKSLLLRIDPTTGAAVPGTFGGDDYIELAEQATRKQISDIAFDPFSGLLHGVQHDGATYSLVTIDAATGATTELGPTKANTAGIDFDSSGNLWGSDTTPGNGLLAKLSVVDGSVISFFPIDNASGYAALAILDNNAPTFDQDLGDRSHPEGTTITPLPSPATDVDVGDNLTYSATSLPPGLSINPGTGTITGTISMTGVGTYSTEITVIDNGTPSLSDADTFTWTVTNVNEAPTFDQDLPDRTDAENATISLSAAASDDDTGNTLLYGAVGLPSGLSIDTGSGLISGTIDFTAAAGSPHSVSITVQDDGAPVMSAPPDTFTWTVTNTNRAPGVDAIADQSVAENDPFSLTVTASDPDGTTPSLSAAGLPAWATFTDNANGTATITGTPGFSDTATSSVTVTASDGLLTGTEGFDLTVTNTNRAPAVNAIADQSVAENDLFSLTITASDPDGTTPSLSAAGLPAWATFTDNTNGTATITGTPGFNDAGVSSITVTASEGSLTGTEGFDLTVTNTNRPPVADPVGDQSVAENDPFSLTVSASDPDGTTPSLSAAGLPAWATLTDNTDGTATITGTPGFSDAGVSSVIVTASDGFLNGTVAFDLTVTNTNRAPGVDAIADQTVAENDPFSLTVTASDPDGTTPSLSAAGLPAWATFTDNANGTATITGTPGFSDTATSSVTVTASDGLLTGTEGFDLTVTNTNRPPVVADPGSQATTEGSPFSMTLTASDPDGTTPTFGAGGTLPSWGALTDNGDGTASISGTPGYTDSGITTVTMTVSDGSLTDAVTFDIVVFNTDRPPVVDPIADQIIAENDPFSLTVTGSDPDGLTPSLSDSATLPAWAALADNGDGSATITGTPGFSDAGASLVTITANDGALTGTETFRLTVTNTNRAPVVGPIADGTTPEGDLYTLNVGAIDPDGAIPSLTAAGLPAWATFADNGDGTATITGTPGFDDAAVSTVTISASDGSLTGTATFQLTVTNTNRPPVVDLVANQSVAENDPFSLIVTASDPDATMPAITAAGLPTWATLTDHGNGTATIAGTPGFSDAGTTAVAITANDGFLTGSIVFDLTVSNTNRPPAVDPIADQTVAENDSFSLVVAASDPDGATPFLSAAGLPAWATLSDNGDGTATISGTPGFDDAGPTTITVTASDGVLDDDTSFELTVAESNRQPVVAPVANQTVAENDPFSLVVTASDPDATVPAITAAGLPGWATLSDNGDGTATITGTPGFNDAGTSTVTIKAHDAALTATGAFDLTVTNTNRAPSLTNPGPRSLPENHPFNIVATASDADGDPVALTVSGLPTWAVFTTSAGGAAITGTPTAADAGISTVKVIASDGTTTTSVSFTIEVTVPNRAPTVTITGDPATAEGVPFGPIAINGSDPDGTAVTITATGLPAWASLRPDGTVTGTPGYDDAGTSTATIVVTDPGGLSTSAALEIEVANTNRPATVTWNGETSTAEGAPLGPILIAATDPDGDPITIVLAQAPPWIEISLDSDGSTAVITGTPDHSAAGKHTIEIYISDGTDTTPLTFEVEVIATNRVAVGADEDVTTNAETAINLSVLENYVDPDGDRLTVTAVSVPGNGTAALRADATIVYMPASGFEGIDTFTYTVEDGQGGQFTSTVTVRVLAAYLAIYTNKAATGLLIQGMDAELPPPELSAETSRPALSPTDGLRVAFGAAAESLKSQILPALLLGILVAWLLILGVGRRDEEEAAGG